MEDIEKILGLKWIIFNELHTFLLSLDSSIKYRIFPLYITYSSGDKIIAIVFYKGKYAKNEELNIGFALNTFPDYPGFIDASFMNYKGINYCMVLKRASISEKLIVFLKKTIEV